MIKIEKNEKSYMTCTSCNSSEDLQNIIIGFTERQTTTIRLCKKCRNELKEKINP